MVMLLSWGVLAARATVPPTRRPLSPREVFRKAAPSVLLLQAFDTDGNPVSLGSGVVVYRGLIVTNQHVVENATTFLIAQTSGKVAATLLYCDAHLDLCLLSAPALAATPVTLRETENTEIGERVYAIGAPQGLSLTLSEGLISGKRTGAGGSLLQTSAPISHGSSGGGLFDEHARLVGITALSIQEGQNLNFAIPSSSVKNFLDRAGLEVLVERYLAAKGGRVRLNSVRSVRQEGRAFVGDLTLPLSIEWKRPDLYRMDLWLKDQQTTTAFDGIQVWTKDANGVKTGADINPEDRWTIRDTARYFLDQIGIESRPAVELLGIEQLGGGKAYKLWLREEGQGERLVYLDTSSLLEVRIVRQSLFAGKDTRVTIDLSDHTEVSGLVIPLTATVTLTGKDAKDVAPKMRFSLNSVVVNPPIEDQRFAPVADTPVAEKQAILAWLADHLTRMGAEGGEFTRLRDSANREAFLAYLVELNPEVSELCVPFLRREWWVYSAKLPRPGPPRKISGSEGRFVAKSPCEPFRIRSE